MYNTDRHSWRSRTLSVGDDRSKRQHIVNTFQCCDRNIHTRRRTDVSTFFTMMTYRTIVAISHHLVAYGLQMHTSGIGQISHQIQRSAVLEELQVAYNTAGASIPPLKPMKQTSRPPWAILIVKEILKAVKHSSDTNLKKILTNTHSDC